MLEFDRFLCIAASANPLSVKEIVIGLALYPLFLFMADDRLNGSCLMPNDDWLGLQCTAPEVSRQDDACDVKRGFLTMTTTNEGPTTVKEKKD